MGLDSWQSLHVYFFCFALMVSQGIYSSLGGVFWGCIIGRLSSIGTLVGWHSHVMDKHWTIHTS
jgi:hypothetical protein